jgi:hypothetical protein
MAPVVSASFYLNNLDTDKKSPVNCRLQIDTLPSIKADLDVLSSLQVRLDDGFCPIQDKLQINP